MRSNNSTLWLFPICQIYSPYSVCSSQSATLAWRVDVSRASSNISVLLKLSQQFAIALASCDKQQTSFCFRHYFQAYIQVFFWPIRASFLCPFNYRDTITEKIVFKTEINYFIGIIQSIQIKVVEPWPSIG